MKVSQSLRARVALLDARVAETSLQRTQLEELIQSLARSRDENVLADVDAALHRVVEKAGGKSPEEAAAYVEELKKAKRYRKDVY